MIALDLVRKALEGVGLVQGLALEEVHARLATGLRLRDTGQRVLAYYLTELDRRRLYQASGHSSTAHFAEAELGLDRRRSSELLAVGRKLLDLPAIDHAFCTQQIGWAKVLALVAVAVVEHEEAWLARARALSCRALTLETRLVRPGSAPRDPGETKGLPEIRFRVDVDVPTLTHQKLELAKQKLSAEQGRPVTDAECLDVLAETFLQLEHDGSVPGRTRVAASLYCVVLRQVGGPGGLVVDAPEGEVPVPDGALIRCDAESAAGPAAPAATPASEPGSTEAGSPQPGSPEPDVPTPPALRRRVLLRDGQQCRSCQSRHRLMVHHVRLRSEGGPTQAANLVTLCVRCHGLVHDGLLFVHGDDAACATFADARGAALGAVLAEATSAGERVPDLARESRSAAGVSPLAPGPLTTLDAMPGEIDAGWWQRHAHLLHMGVRGLELTPGEPLPPSASPSGASPSGAAPASAAPASAAPTMRRTGAHALAHALGGLTGDAALVERLSLAAEASLARARPFPHLLLVGAPGMGKTTVAHGVAVGLGARLVKASGPLLTDVQQLLGLLAGLRERDVFFVEEVHAVARPVLEALYEAMAEGRVTLTFTRAPRGGVAARSVAFRLPSFTLVAATTEEGDLPTPFLSRFGLCERLGPYEPEVLREIVTRRGTEEAVSVDADAALLLARHARGTPREALRLTERVLDAAAVERRREVHVSDARATLARLGFDARGLGPLERAYLALLRVAREPISLARLSTSLGAGVRTLLRDVEPFLVRRGLVAITPHGRTATQRGRFEDPGASSREVTCRTFGQLVTQTPIPRACRSAADRQFQP